MRLSKRDYEKLVGLIKVMEKGRTRRLMWGIALAELMKHSNPLFDKGKFVTACAGDEDE